VGLNHSQGTGRPFFSVGTAFGEEVRKHHIDRDVHRHHLGHNDCVHVQRQQKHGGRTYMGLVCLGIGLLLPVVQSIPQYYTEGYGCKLTGKAGPWSEQMRIDSDALSGNVYWNTEKSVAFKCPREYGIIVQMNTTAGNDGWFGSKDCPNTFSTKYYNGKTLTPFQLPARIEYMCTTHRARHWYSGSFSVDRAGEIGIETYFATADFNGGYASSTYYRGMQYSALGIILAGLIGVVAVMAPVGSTERQISAYVTMALVFAAFVWIVVAVSKIRKASPRPYSFRVYHAGLGYFTIVIIAFTLVLGAVQFYKRTLETVFKATVTLMLLLTIATSAVALENFYGYDRGLIVSIAIILGVLFVSAMFINRQATALYTPENLETSIIEKPKQQEEIVYYQSGRPRRKERKSFF